jgi:hypothetical protein
MESDLSASSALEALLSAPNAERAVPTLQTLFLNILCSPDEPKFRRLRASNPALQAKLLSVAGAVELLRAVGFVEEGDFFVLAPGLALPQAVIERIAAVAEELAAAAPTADEAGGGGGGDAGGGGGGGGGGAAGGASHLPPATDEFKWCSNCRACIDGRLPKNSTFRCLACDIDLCSQCYNLRSCDHDFELLPAKGGGLYGPRGLPPPPPPSSRPSRR